MKGKFVIDIDVGMLAEWVLFLMCTRSRRNLVRVRAIARQRCDDAGRWLCISTSGEVHADGGGLTGILSQEAVGDISVCKRDVCRRSITNEGGAGSRGFMVYAQPSCCILSLDRSAPGGLGSSEPLITELLPWCLEICIRPCFMTRWNILTNGYTGLLGARE
ncbi:hypothetical protein BX600DRAFT_255724 [Xylariales sp. PMI_506]|nr:hypothetical protein BX600DRAFT_255724 [Xylariales sp. PMI_506]